MSQVTTAQNVATNSSFHLRWITPQAKKQILALDSKYRDGVLQSLSNPIGIHRCKHVHGSNWAGVRRYATSCSIRVCFVEQNREYTVVHVGFHKEFETFADHGKPLPSISARTSMKEFLLSQKKVPKPSAANQELPSAKVPPIVAEPDKALINALMKMLKDQVTAIRESSLQEYYFDEVTKNLADHTLKTEATLESKLSKLIDNKLKSILDRIGHMECQLKTATEATPHAANCIDSVIDAAPTHEQQALIPSLAPASFVYGDLMSQDAA